MTVTVTEKLIELALPAGAVFRYNAHVSGRMAPYL